MIYKMPYESKTRHKRKNEVDLIREGNTILYLHIRNPLFQNSFSDFDKPVIDKDYKRWEDNTIPTHNLEEENLIPSHNLEEDSLIPSHNLEEDKKPIIQFRPGRPQILDLSHVIQFRPRPTSPPFRFPL